MIEIFMNYVIKFENRPLKRLEFGKSFKHFVDKACLDIPI